MSFRTLAPEAKASAVSPLARVRTSRFACLATSPTDAPSGMEPLQIGRRLLQVVNAEAGAQHRRVVPNSDVM